VHALTALAVLRLGLSLAAGLEWDSNANRAEIVANGADADMPQASFLLRTTAQGRLSWATQKNILRATAGLGGKVFFDPAVQDQDVLVLQLGVEDRVRVARKFHLAIVTDYYDAWQLSTGANRHRDFRNGNVQGRVYLLHRLGEIAVTGGYRGFEYKPNDDFTFQGGQLGINAITRLRFGRNEDQEIDFASSYRFERRFFDGPAAHLNESQHVPPPTPSTPACSLGQPIEYYCVGYGPDLRNDWLHEMGVEATYVGPLLVTIGYGAQLNTSSSFGESLFRHIFTLKLAYRLPWSLYATAKAQLFVTKYLDPVLLDFNIQQTGVPSSYVTIDDENRNALILDLERPIGTTGLAIDVRYSWFTNELASQSTVHFQRHVIYLGLTYRVGAR
jgi:hypothetical protein